MVQGLVGLADRVAALDGSLRVENPVRRGHTDRRGSPRHHALRTGARAAVGGVLRLEYWRARRRRHPDPLHSGTDISIASHGSSASSSSPTPSPWSPTAARSPGSERVATFVINLDRRPHAMSNRESTGNIASALERNRAFAAAGCHEGAVVFPSLRLMVITCLDPRVDPAHFLGLGLSDAMVVRNVGGRVTEQVIDDVAFIGQIAEYALPDGRLFEVAVIHHTQCGAGALADDTFRRRYAERIGADESSLRQGAVLDPERPSRATSTACAPHRRSRRALRCPGTSTTFSPAWWRPSSPQSTDGLWRHHRTHRSRDDAEALCTGLQRWPSPDESPLPCIVPKQQQRDAGAPAGSRPGFIPAPHGRRLPPFAPTPSGGIRGRPCRSGRRAPRSRRCG